MRDYQGMYVVEASERNAPAPGYFSNWQPISDRWYKGNRQATLAFCRDKWPNHDFRVVAGHRAPIISV